MENNYRLKGLEGPPASPLQVSLVYEYMSKGWGGAKPRPTHKAAKKNRKVELPSFLTIFKQEIFHFSCFQQDGMTNGRGFSCPILDNRLEPYQDEKIIKYLEG